tara:strand:- start:8316 stop:8882 length:567 start_codon:yes stop_codon:yes gene_type:complete
MNDPDYGKISLWIAAIVCSILLLPHLTADVIKYENDKNNLTWHGHTVDLNDDEDIVCLAKNVYFEAANQSFAGKLAVAHVVINREHSNMFPNSVCGVIYQAKTKINWKGNEVPIRNQCQFSWYCDGKSDEPKDSETWLDSLWIADLVLSGAHPDITEGSLWYHADFVEPYWSKQLELVTVIDNHLFYK